MKLPERSVNLGLTTPEREVVLIESVDCAAGDRFSLTFESAEPRWRQGVWLAVDGDVVAAGQVSSQILLWRDTAPDQVEIEVRSTGDGLMRLYNVWDSGRGHGHESQRHTSGMVREALPDGYRYHCSDINPAPTFEALVFSVVRHQPSVGGDESHDHQA
ncbi:hypothetical protein Q9R29_05525 [Rothia sp. ARF10]|nr:hypothetical protein [Rothia sp. ARF10]